MLNKIVFNLQGSLQYAKTTIYVIYLYQRDNYCVPLASLIMGEFH